MSPQHSEPDLSQASTLRTTVFFLEMDAPPSAPAPAEPQAFRIERAIGITVPFYRYLYNTVGAEFLWYERRALDDIALAAIIHDPAVEVHVTYARGVPAGFFELDRRHPTDIDLAYFGLMADFIGRGIGGWFLRRAIDTAWSYRPRTLTVNTNSFDHPRALETYRRAGFVVARQLEREFEDPRAAGLL